MSKRKLLKLLNEGIGVILKETSDLELSLSNNDGANEVLRRYPRECEAAADFLIFDQLVEMFRKKRKRFGEDDKTPDAQLVFPGLILPERTKLPPQIPIYPHFDTDTKIDEDILPWDDWDNCTLEEIARYERVHSKFSDDVQRTHRGIVAFLEWGKAAASGSSGVSLGNSGASRKLPSQLPTVLCVTPSCSAICRWVRPRDASASAIDFVA